ncbi:hypothetical protein ACPVPU_11260 [Sphingomonas sp. CJ99]
MSLQFYAVLKEAIQDDTGLANTLLHLHGGLLILIAARMATRKPLGTFIPFLVVLVLELLNEGIDRINHGSWRWPDTTSDIVNTLFWPFVLSLGVRLRPIADAAAKARRKPSAG